MQQFISAAGQYCKTGVDEMGKKKKGSSKAAKKPLYPWIPAVIIAVMIALLPLLAVPVDVLLQECELWLVPNQNGILTSYCTRFREYAVFAAGCILLLYWAGERIFPDRTVDSPLLKEKASLPVLICSGVYLLMAVISAVFSEFGEISFWGLSTENEGAAAAFGYIMLFLGGYCWLRGGRARVLSLGALTAAGAICVLYLIEAISGSQLTQLLWDVEDARSGTALLFGNPGVCGEYCVLLFPVLLMSGASADRRAMRLAYSIAAGAMLCVAVSSRSTAAFAGMTLALILCIPALLIPPETRKRAVYSAAVLFPLIIMTAADFGGTMKALQISAGNLGAYTPDECYRLTDIDISGDSLTLYSGGDTLTITLTEKGAEVFGNGEPLGMLSSEMNSLSGSFSAVSARLDGGLLQLDLGYDDTIEFQATDGEIIYIGLNGYLIPEPSESAFPQLSEYYSIATGRGYIWLNSIPILKDCILKGVGAGAFAYYFPQDDIVGMLNTHGSTALLTDRAHSLYLGTAIADGMPALAALLCIAFLSIKRSLSGGAVRQPLRAGEFISVLCFLLMGIANDSSPVTSPIFWIMAGAACVPVDKDA